MTKAADACTRGFARIETGAQSLISRPEAQRVLERSFALDSRDDPPRNLADRMSSLLSPWAWFDGPAHRRYQRQDRALGDRLDNLCGHSDIGDVARSPKSNW
jgi:hypothetical protein